VLGIPPYLYWRRVNARAPALEGPRPIV
jgi:hypothetical protein